MYLQLTTKCNFSCEHCCFACTNHGRHGDTSVLKDAIDFVAEHSERITFGGGEPTLHPDFWELLEYAFQRDLQVFMVTNGSNTNTMRKLAAIMEGEDMDEHTETCGIHDCECTEEDQEMGYYCECCDCYLGQYSEQLTVAVSSDYYHDPIDPWVIDTWKRHKWELRDVTQTRVGVISSGRAKNWGTDGECVCGEIFIKPNGKIKPCGCLTSPVVGDVWSGYELSEKMQDNLDWSGCYKGGRND